MRISDWSSDVCSSDLGRSQVEYSAAGRIASGLEPVVRQIGFNHEIAQIGRASCRERGWQTCRSRWSPYHYKNTRMMIHVCVSKKEKDKGSMLVIIKTYDMIGKDLERKQTGIKY